MYYILSKYIIHIYTHNIYTYIKTKVWKIILDLQCLENYMYLSSTMNE